MKSKKSSLFLCRVLVSLIVVLVIVFLGLAVRAFATVDTTQFIFSAASAISVTILVLSFMLVRPARDIQILRLHTPIQVPTPTLLTLHLGVMEPPRNT